MKDLEKLNAEIELKQDVLSKAAHKKRMFSSEHGGGEASGSNEQVSYKETRRIIFNVHTI